MILFEPTLPADRDMSFPGYLDLAFVIFVIAGLTDFFDGFAARKLNVASKFGRMVDPIADKVLICGSFMVFALIGQPTLFDFTKAQNTVVQWSFAGIIIAREVLVTILRHYSEAISGKLKMLVQSFAVGTVIVKMAHVQTALWGYWFTMITYIITVLVTVISGYFSIRKLKTPAI
jgi:CDP-diacylglycerol--glycerol-3-phosphate 3-phosphatidyltransferase